MTPRQTKALEGLIKCKTKRAAAEYAGISESTLRTYFKSPDFVAAYKKELSDLIDDAAAQAKQALSPAMSVFTEIALDNQQPASARISAARSIFEYGLRLTEITDILKVLEDAEG